MISMNQYGNRRRPRPTADLLKLQNLFSFSTGLKTGNRSE